MGDYHDLYLKFDILLLADVFENFRSTCLQYYKLDPCHYVTSPGLSWDAMLKMTDIKLELMSDIDMFQFVEKGTRGGISYIANRYIEDITRWREDMNFMFEWHLPREHKIHIFELTCNVLFIIWRNQFNKSKRRES